MQATAARNTRIYGVFVLISGLPLFAMGLWLLWNVLAQPLPEWLQKPIRLGAHLRIDGLGANSTNADRLSSQQGVLGLMLLNMGGIAVGQGVIMLLLGRRSVAESALMLGLAAALLGFAWTI